MATDSKIAIAVSGDSTLRYLSELQSSHSSRLALRPATPSKFHPSQTLPTPYSPFLTTGPPVNLRILICSNDGLRKAPLPF